MGLLPGDLSFDSGARTEGHGNELADESIPRVDAVQPRLIGQRNVILRVTSEVLDPWQAADRTHFAHTDLQSSGFGSIERQPHCLALVDRQHDAATRQPLGWRGVGVVRNSAQRKPAQAGRQRMQPRLGDSQRPLKLHRHRAQHQLVPDDLYRRPARHDYLHLGVLPIWIAPCTDTSGSRRSPRPPRAFGPPRSHTPKQRGAVCHL